MKTYEFNIKLKRNRQVTLYLSPNKDEDIFVDEKASGVPFQLIEGKRYYFELSDADFYIDGDSQIIKCYPSRSGVSNGEITTGNFVGTFSADIKSKDNNETQGKLFLEIRSTKIGYEDDYRKMMEDISEYCTELLMQQSSPVTQNYTIDKDADPQTHYERFAFVKSLVESESFEDAITQIETQPIVKWEDVEEERPTQSLRRLGSHGLRQMATSNRRMKLHDSDPLCEIIDSVPEVIRVQSRRDTTDVAENRFVKFVLNSFLGFCLSIRSNQHAQERLKHEADEVCQRLFQYLAHPLFRRLGNLTTMPLGSPTLQKRAGYREILQKWLMFDMAAKLSWEGGEDVYSAGQKNVARLYEYWLFFKLLKEFSRKFRIQPIEKSKLLQVTEGHLGLCLKEGRMQVMHGTYTYKGRKLNMVFAYNRTFAYTKDYEKSGSWSQQMRPDYTLSVWPGDIDNPEDAERQDLITHIHFDAKYRVDNLINEFRKGADIDLSDIKHEEERGTYKRADLLKMHAYKDAIKRSAGAYVLYPGTENPDPFLNFHEIIPGLGAFAISPRNSNVSYFLKFIDDVIENFLNRTSQRERMQHHRYQDLQVPGISVFDELPEPKDDERTLPDETFVLVGYTRTENTAWIGDKMLYPARIGAKAKGSIILDKNVVSARYLLTYNAQGQQLFKIDTDEGIKVVTKKELAASPYEYNNPHHDNYMLFHLKEAEPEFKGLSFDIKQLNEEAYKSKEVFAVSLAKLITKKIIDKV